MTRLPYAVASRYEEAVPGLLTGVEARRMAAILVGWADACLQGKTRD